MRWIYIWLSICHMMDIWVVSIFWLLWITLLWTFMYMFLYERMFLFLLGVHLKTVSKSHADSVFTFWGAVKLPSQRLNHFAFPLIIYRGSDFSTSLPILTRLVPDLVVPATLLQDWEESRYGSVYTSLMTGNVQHLLIHYLAGLFHRVHTALQAESSECPK